MKGELPRRTARSPELAALGIMALALLLLIGWVLLASLALHGAPCPNPPDRTGSWPPLVIVGLCIAFFGLGRTAGYWRQPGEAPHGSPDAAERERRVRRAAVLQGALTGFLMLTVVLLGYETYSLAHVDVYWPITYYVRCANELATLPTVAGACVVSFLLGHWLWYPRRGT